MIKISMNRFTFIKLPIKCILNLAAIPRHEDLQVLSRFHSNFECSCDLKNITAISMQVNFSHIINFKNIVIFSVLLTNGDYIRYLL